MADNAPFDDEAINGNTENAREMVRMWRTWRTVFEMLADRVSITGYMIYQVK